MKRTYTFRIERPDDPATLSAGMAATAELVAKNNKFVDEIKVQLEGPDVLLILTLQGIDQWLIKKRVVFPVAAILLKNGLKLKDARLHSVDKPERKARAHPSGGGDDDEMIDHTDMMSA